MPGKGESEEGPQAQAVQGRLKAWLRPHLPVLLLALGLMLLQSGATLVQPWLAGVLTDRLLLDQHLGTLLWLLFGLISAQQGLGYITSIQLQKVSGRLVADASAELYAHLQALPLAWHHARQRGDVLALLGGDVHRLTGYLTGIVLPLMFIVLKLYGRGLRPLAHASAQAWADQSATAEQNLESLPLIKAFATEQAERANYRARADAIFDVDLRLARREGVINPVVHVVGAGAILLLLGLGGHWVVGEQLRMGQLVSLFLYGMVLIAPVSTLASVFGSTLAAAGSLRRLQEAMTASPEVDEGEQEQIPAHADVVFEGVDFTYPGREPLFRDLNLCIRAGETVALTGINGAGKSTLVHLLLRLVEPQGGKVVIGPFDVREYRLQALRSQIGLVAQQVLLFNATIADNITYGRVDATREAIESAARAARAHDFITALPDGYATVVGDQGVRLSGGQRQRIALARALLRDPAILILDEATAMFDPEGEAEFIEACRDILAQRTVIMITHRPASLALADRVLRLEGGRLL